MKDTTRIVVDAGNTRLKWGRCVGTSIPNLKRLSLQDIASWEEAWKAWQLDATIPWAISGSNPPAIQGFTRWLQGKQANVFVINDYRQLRLDLAVDNPETVGLDRLLNAIAIDSFPAVIITAGSAVTLDYVDEHKRFRGGSIAPGLAMMFNALHQQTAKLPLLKPSEEADILNGSYPGIDTRQAMELGVWSSFVGSVKYLLHLIPHPYEIFLTGGDGARLLSYLPLNTHLDPTLTLQGIRRATES